MIDTVSAGSITRWPGQVNPGQSGFRAQIDATGSTGTSGSGSDYWAIGSITVAGDIGASGSPVIIRSKAGVSSFSDENYRNGGIQYITARSAYVDIETSIPTDSGPNNTASSTNSFGGIRGITLNLNNADTSSTAGVLAGTVKTFSFGYDTNDQTPSLNMWGQLQGQVLLDGTFKQPVKIRRGIASGATVSLLEKDYAVDNEGLEVTGTMAGRIEIEGNKNAPLTVIGDVTGTIDIGKSIRNAAATSPDYGGRVHIDGGSLTSTGVIDIGGTVLDTPNRTEIEIDGDMAGQINIGKSLAGQVKMGSGGLKGQIIINQNNGSGANAGTWASTGVVQVGTTEIKTSASSPNHAPYYTAHASDLGGGAVGLAPFHLYEGDWSPPHDQTSTTGVLTSDFDDTSNTPVEIVQYGPVAFGPGSGSAVKIEAQNPNSPCDWWDMTSMFGTVVLAPAGTNARTIGLRGSGAGVPYKGLYRVSIVSNRLISDRVGTAAGQPKLVWSQVVFASGCTESPYYFFRIDVDCNGNHVADVADIAADSDLDANLNGVIDACEMTPMDVCLCDWNHNTYVSVQDIFDFLADYFAGNADFNSSGTTSVQDIFDFLTCFFGRPSPCQPL